MVNAVPASGRVRRRGGVIAWADSRTGVSPTNPVVPVTVTVAFSHGGLLAGDELGDDACR